MLPCGFVPTPFPNHALYTCARHIAGCELAKVPVRLEQDPILEAIFELRFQGKVPSLSEILQGVLYPPFKGRFPTVTRTPMASFPPALIEGNPSLRYQPRLELKGEHIGLFLGDHSIIVNCAKPYVGWAALRPLILEVLELVKSADIIGDPERMSLKYVNLLEGDSIQVQFSKVRYSASLGRYNLTDCPTNTRTEIQQDDHVNIVELSAGAIVTTPAGVPLNGMLVSVDSIFNNPPDYWRNFRTHIEKTHGVEKSIFFEILTEQTINSLGPVWA